ncbi:dUTP diphosphatase [Amaricoccus tamworthensis]|uniref:dUTP diphosphatase n=1 Tax=Amaricoccus tamworthensis TaxID=57002 RepID=UPI003C7D0E5C
MSNIEIAIKLLEGYDPELPLPSYASSGAAGMDVVACLAFGERETGHGIAPGERWLVPTGLAMAIPEGFEVQVRPRSGLALKHGLTLANSPGTVDCDYRGEVAIIVINHGPDDFVVEHGMRIAQLVVAPVTRARFQLVDTLDMTARGQGGFGSTGLASHGKILA